MSDQQSSALGEREPPDENTIESLKADIDYLVARIEALKNHPSAYESLRLATQELLTKQRTIATLMQDA